MKLPAELVVIHEPARLRIMGALYRDNDIAVATLRGATGLTAGNLASHTARLVEAGFVESREALTTTGFEKRLQITVLGMQRFAEYLDFLDAVLQAARSEPAPQATKDQATPRASGKATGAAVSVGAIFVLSEALQQALSDASGSSYVGIAMAGLLVSGVPLLTRLVR